MLLVPNIDVDEVAKIQERREAEIRRQKAENYAKFEKEVTLFSRVFNSHGKNLGQLFD